MEITLATIRTAAERLAAAHVATTARASLLQDEIKTAVTPIYDRHRTGLDAAAEEEARARDELQQLLEGAPQLFTKPRSFVINGVRAGYRKEEDSLFYADETAVIARIRALIPDQADLLIRTEESLVADALPQLDGNARRRVGISLITGVDRAFITIGDSDVEKLARTLIADAIRRVGDEEAAPKKKGKAKIKESV
jgi:hypothetical protein